MNENIQPTPVEVPRFKATAHQYAQQQKSAKPVRYLLGVSVLLLAYALGQKSEGAQNNGFIALGLGQVFMLSSWYVENRAVLKHRESLRTEIVRWTLLAISMIIITASFWIH